MKPSEIESILSKEIRQIAPDIDISTIDRETDLQEELDIDSMDFLNLIIALSQQFKIDMPEVDYPKMNSYNAMITYLAAHTQK